MPVFVEISFILFHKQTNKNNCISTSLGESITCAPFPLLLLTTVLYHVEANYLIIPHSAPVRNQKSNSPYYTEEVTETQRTSVTFHDYIAST